MITTTGLKSQGPLIKALPASPPPSLTKVQFGSNETESSSMPRLELPFNLQEKLQQVLQTLKAKVQAFMQQLIIKFNQWASALEQFGKEREHLQALGIHSQKAQWEGTPQAFYQEVVKPAFHEKAKALHPDRPNGDSAKFQAVNEANQFLKALYTEPAQDAADSDGFAASENAENA